MKTFIREEDRPNSHFAGNCALCHRACLDDELTVYAEDTYICDDCAAKFHNELKYANNFEGINKLSKGAAMMLEGLSDLYGIDHKDDNFRDTPYRVARLMMELNYGTNIQAAKDILTVSFPSDNKYTGLISSNNIRVSSLCPHHMVVVDYKVSLAYIPCGGRCVGLSKLPRLAKILAKSMMLQEDYTEALVNVLEEQLQPMGCAAMVKGVHNCIQARGAEMRDIDNTTIALRGSFAHNQSLKEEWLHSISSSNNC